MRVLDAGCGTGAVAREISRLVGPRGSVVGLDDAAHRLAFGAGRARGAGCRNLRWLTGSVYAPPLAPGRFDLVWSRFLFGYLEDPDAALRQLAGLARVGGKVVVGEVDGHGLFHHPLPPLVEDGLQKLTNALRGRFDPLAGRKLHHRFRRAGLEQVRAHVLPYHVYGEELSRVQLRNWQIKLDTLRPVGVLALGGPERYDAFERAFLDLLQDPDAFTYSVLIIVEGVRGPSTLPCRPRC
jgi:SAM-dependent methyltransferase